MNEQQIAQAALEFLKRSPLRGEEAEAFLVVRKWLEGKVAEAAPAEPASLASADIAQPPA